MMPYERTKSYSNDVLEKLRKQLPSIAGNNLIAVSGSFARREASSNSDFDYFIVASPSAKSPNEVMIKNVNIEITKIVAKQPAPDGAFAQIQDRSEMLRNIGGLEDDNNKITRRILFLLEGEWLTNEADFKKLRREILEHYIRNTITDHQLALFLLNDIIRYYRTMAVDYEFKTHEASKPWAIRNIKLMFSRKMLYASGLFSVATTADHEYQKKIGRLEHLFDLPPVDRMIEICGSAQMERVLSCYNHFLDKLESTDLRKHLDRLTKEQRSDSKFREIKNEGHHFTRHLLALFENTFGSNHPIMRAVVF